MQSCGTRADTSLVVPEPTLGHKCLTTSHVVPKIWKPKGSVYKLTDLPFGSPTLFGLYLPCPPTFCLLCGFSMSASPFLSFTLATLLGSHSRMSVVLSFGEGRAQSLFYARHSIKPHFTGFHRILTLFLNNTSFSKLEIETRNLTYL